METEEHRATRRVWRRRALWLLGLWVVALIVVVQWPDAEDDQVGSLGDEDVDALVAQLYGLMGDYIAVDPGLSNEDYLAEEREVVDDMVATYDALSDAVDESDVSNSVRQFSDAFGDFVEVVDDSTADLERCMDGDTSDAALESCALWSQQVHRDEIRKAAEDLIESIPDDLDLGSGA